MQIRDRVLDGARIPDGDTVLDLGCGHVAADVVTARSVLMYLDREGKRRALPEAARVLRPGGRLSVWEPINRFSFPEPPDRLYGFDVGPVREIAAKVKAAMEASAETGPANVNCSWVGKAARSGGLAGAE